MVARAVPTGTDLIKQERTVLEALRRVRMLPANDQAFLQVYLTALHTLITAEIVATHTLITAETAVTVHPALYFTQAGTGAVERLIADRLRDSIDAQEFGVIGDAVTDDTVNIQKALDAGLAQNKVVNFSNLRCRISGTLSMSGPGLCFDRVSHGNEYDGVTPATAPPGFLITGTGYTAMTVTGAPQRFQACFYGTGQTTDGVLFQNPQRANIQHVRVFKLDGFGVKINKCWDCLWQIISVEECGKNSGGKEAFSVNDDGDTSNTSHFLRIQVEKATAQAIAISGSTLSCVFDNIHSEQAVGVAGVDTWFFGGSRCQYNSARLTAIVPGNATAHFQPGDAHFQNFLIEDGGGGALRVLVDSATGTAINTFVDFEIQGKLDIGIQIGFDPMFFQFLDCNITVLTQSSSHAAATFTNCDIANTTSGDAASGTTVGFLVNVCTLINCQVGCSTALVRSGAGMLRMIGSTISSDLSYRNHSPIRMTAQSKVAGIVSCGDGGLVDILADRGCTVGFGSSGIGVPTNGAHVIGDCHTALAPAAGSPKGWMCEASGTPGTFTSEGNL